MADKKETILIWIFEKKIRSSAIESESKHKTSSDLKWQ